MGISYAERDRIANTVIENYGGVEALRRDLQSGEFGVYTLQALIREGIWIAGIEAENAPDIVPGSEEDLIQRAALGCPCGGTLNHKWGCQEPVYEYGYKALGEAIVPSTEQYARDMKERWGDKLMRRPKGADWEEVEA